MEFGRRFGYLTIAFICAALAGCGSGGSNGSDGATPAPSTAPTATPTESPAQRAAAAKAAAQRAAAEHDALAAQHRADAEAKRQLRIPMFAYWQAASSSLDKATQDADDGATAIRNDDLVSASSSYSNCSSDADDAKSQSASNIPDGWNDVSNAFFMAAGKLEDACKSAVAAIDDQRPSEIAAAESSMNDFKTYQILAAGKAIELWVAAGGDPKSL